MPSPQSFSFTGSAQTFVVPDDVTVLDVDVVGAAGGGSNGVVSSLGGKGGRVQCSIDVTPGETLQINVGGKGQTKTASNGSAGGFNGGGNGDGAGNPSNNYGGGGGGASDIRRINDEGWDVFAPNLDGIPSYYGFNADGGSAPTGWTPQTGRQVWINTGGLNYFSLFGPADSGDRIMELELKVDGDPGGSGIAKMFGQWISIGNQSRYVDVGFYANKIRIDDNGNQYDTASLDLTNWRKVKVVITGTTLNIYIDNNSLFYTRTIDRTYNQNGFWIGQGSSGSSGSWYVRSLKLDWGGTPPTYPLGSRLVVAPGGGGMGANDQLDNTTYGKGGTPTGGTGRTGSGGQPGSGGTGGTQTTGGVAGSGQGTGSPGVLGIGGAGKQDGSGRGGGGGGGGLYGGGGGGMAGAGSSGGGGGGGSGLSSGLNETLTDGYSTGEGSLVLSWSSVIPSDSNQDAGSYIYENIGLNTISAQEGDGYLFENVGFNPIPLQEAEGYLFENVGVTSPNTQEAIAYLYEEPVLLTIKTTIGIPI